MRTNVDRCSEWRALASCRLDGELDELQTARLERHLLGCAPCRSWTSEIAGLAGVFRDSMAGPERLPELQTRALRRRLVRSVSAVSAASAAAVAAAAVFAIAVPGSAISLFSPGSAPVVSSAPCASCMKKRALTTGTPETAVAPVHVAHPLESKESPS